jgi:hypothetical protein
MATRSPCFFFQATNVPSVIVSLSLGIVISAMDRIEWGLGNEKLFHVEH